MEETGCKHQTFFYLSLKRQEETDYKCQIFGFPDSSLGKESPCNAGDPGLIPGSGRFPGEGIGYPLQHSWASLGAQTVKNPPTMNPPTMQETWVQSLSWEDPLEKGKAYPLQYSGLEKSMDYIVHGVAKSPTRLSEFKCKCMC